VCTPCARFNAKVEIKEDFVTEKQLPEGIHTIELVFADIYGLLRGKKIPAGQWDRVRREGSHIPGAPLYWGVRCECRDESPAGGIDDGFPDVTIMPDASTMRVLPWRPGVAQVQCIVQDDDGIRSELCPRNALIDLLEQFEAENLTPMVALEMEFYLLDPQTHQPLTAAMNTYGVYDASPYDAILTDITKNLVDYGLPVEAAIQELAAGQMEITLRYDHALKAVDDAIFMRSAVKELAAKHGLVATYMAKPFDEESGSGLHIHHSIWRDGVALFDPQPGESGPSELAMNFLGGMQKHIGDFSLFGSWSMNDYKRRQDFTFSPTRDSWGGDNRTVAIRMIDAHGSFRFEQRDACATSNLYLTLAGQLAAGLDGVRNKLQPAAKCEGNSYTDPLAVELPRHVPQAIERLHNSTYAREIFPALLIDTYIDTIKYEYLQVALPVTEIERNRYIGAL
jgi:glutamine synthetase